MQKGKIYPRGNWWMLRYLLPDPAGARGWKDTYVKLARLDEYGTARSVEHLAKPYLERANATRGTAATQTLARFVAQEYFPHIEKEGKLSPSTVAGYKPLFEKHIKPRIGDVRLCDFTTATAYQFFKQVAEETQLSDNSLKNIKWVLSAIFNWALNTGAVITNPVEKAERPKGAKSSETHAYTMAEFKAILKALENEPVAKTVVAVAGFTGLRKSELQGLRWGDLQDDALYVSRAVWGTHVRDTMKTKASKAPVAVGKVLGKYLEAHRNGFPEDGFIFTGAKLRRPLNLANLARRVIVPTLTKAEIPWHGWHAFRRMLSTELHQQGQLDDTIKSMLRHGDVRTTDQHYIKKTAVPDPNRRALSAFENRFKKAERKTKKR